MGAPPQALLHVLVFATILAGTSRAQQTIFNVPSPDVLGKGELYLEMDNYLRPWATDSGSAHFFLVRGVAGVGSEVEVGLNAGAFDYRDGSKPFLDAALKWRPFEREFGDGHWVSRAGVVLGDNAGIGLHDEVSGDFRNYLYAAGFLGLSETRTRLSIGPYHATRDVFDDDRRFGAQVTLEQPFFPVPGLTLAADWLSGDGAAATVGAIWGHGPLTLYAGYGFANLGRDDDLLTLEVGFKF